MHCNLRPPEPRQSFAALNTTPCQIWRRRIYPLPYNSVSAADTSLYAVTLTFDLWPWTFAAYRLWRTRRNYVPNLNAIEQFAVELLRFHCLTLWSWACFKCCARLWDNFHLVWPSTTYPCPNYSVFDAGMLCQAVTFTFDLESSWYIIVT